MAEAQQAWRSALGPEHPNTLTAIDNLAGVLLVRGKLDEAEPLFRQVREVQASCPGPGAPQHAEPR